LKTAKEIKSIKYQCILNPDNEVKVLQIFIQGSIKNFNYIVFSEKTKVGIHFDPFDSQQTLPVAAEAGVEIKYLLNTHKHWDHIKDNEGLLDQTGCEFKEMADGERLFLSDNEYVQALSTPGHVDGHIAFLLIQDEEPIGLIAGDTLFNAGVGNCKNGGNVSELFVTTTEVINRLDDQIKVYPSHDYMQTNLEFAKTVEPDNSEIDNFLKRRKSGYFITTMEQERKVNPFLRVGEPSLKKHFPDKNEEEIFYALRAKRDKW
jgi:hydroxyacylglutathione hydrolase